MYGCECARVCNDSIKTTGRIITKLTRWILYDKSWSNIVFSGDADSFVDSGSFSMILYH